MENPWSPRRRALDLFRSWRRRPEGSSPPISRNVPNATLQERCDYVEAITGLSVSRPTMCRAIARRIGSTRKRGRSEADPSAAYPDHLVTDKVRRHPYQRKILFLLPDNLVRGCNSGRYLGICPIPNVPDILPARGPRMRDNRRVWNTGTVSRRLAPSRRYTRRRSRTSSQRSPPTSSRCRRVRLEVALTCFRARRDPSKCWGYCALRMCHSAA